MLLQNKKVAIIGGGPGGLTLARLLQLKSVDVKVYDRDFDKNARLIGSPLDLHKESGLAAIIKANLLDEFKNNFRAGADKKKILNEKAELFYSDHDTKTLENFESDHFRPEIDRPQLQHILLESLEPETIFWNHHFISMEKENEGWLLHFKNGKSDYADIVIAADGANSKIRSYITNIKPFYSGITMLEININEAKKNAPKINALLNGGKIMAFGNSKCILGGQKGNDEIGFYVSLKIEENWAKNSGLDFSDKSQMLNWFKKEYSEWNPIYYELFENPELPLIPRPIYCMPLNQTWESSSNLTMIGDAAHTMPPFAGEGANMAMLDALELSENLTDEKFKTLKEVICFFEKNMWKRAAFAAKESLDNGEMMHSKDALKTMLGFFEQHT